MLPGDGSSHADDNEEEERFKHIFNFIVNHGDFPVHERTVSMAMQLFYNA
jgi:hypothetical protein